MDTGGRRKRVPATPSREPLAIHRGLPKKADAAVNPGGQVITLKFAPNDDRAPTPLESIFALTTLGNTRQE